MEVLNNFKDLFLSVWDKGIMGVDFVQIIIGIIIFFIFLVFRGLISKLIIKKLEIISKRTTNKLDDTFVKSMVGPARFLPIVLGVFFASYYMSFAEETRDFVDNINRTLITILIFWIIHQIIEPVSYILSGLDKILTRELIGWIIKSLKILIFILGAAAVLELWGIKIGPIIAGLGLFGVAVALGAQDLFKNLISGVLVLIEKRFKKGDVVIIEGVIEGVVENIGFRSTAIRRFDKSLCFIPNNQFAENAVTNVSKISNRRINWLIGLEYKSTTRQLKLVCSDIQKKITNNNKDFFVTKSTPVIVKINEFSASSIDILVRCFANTKDFEDFLSIKDRLAIDIKEIVEKRKCSFAFPSQSLYIEKN
jgi:MscS family membrane protein